MKNNDVYKRKKIYKHFLNEVKKFKDININTNCFLRFEHGFSGKFIGEAHPYYENQYEEIDFTHHNDIQGVLSVYLRDNEKLNCTEYKQYYLYNNYKD